MKVYCCFVSHDDGGFYLDCIYKNESDAILWLKNRRQNLSPWEDYDDFFWDDFDVLESFSEE